MTVVVRGMSDEGCSMSGGQETRTMRALVRERIDRWRDGDEPDAAAALMEHPELRGAKSLVMDLALAEYSLRTAAGDVVTRDEFCDRFPTYRQSIAKMLDVQDFLDRCPGCSALEGADEEQARWPLLGEEFLGYELVEPLGRGGLARVYLARERELGGRLVVVKISRHGSHEAAALGKLSHPSVAPIYSVKQDAARAWTVICMPLVGVATGIDLLDAAFAAGAVRNGALVERVAVETRPLEAIQESGIRSQGSGLDWALSYDEAVGRIGVQLAEGLAAAHAAGIMHRDIKPSNILLAWTGRAMLLDFNLSTDASAEDAGFGGTLAYMAPEVMECVLERRPETARRFDPRCDVYSLGAVLFELLTGRLPARPENAEKLSPLAYEEWLECKRARIEAPVDGEADSRLMGIVLRCLEFDPAARYTSAEEVAAALKEYLRQAARPRGMRKLRRRAAIAAGVALVAGGGAAWAYVANRPLTLDEIYQRGLAEYERGKYEEAVGTFTECIGRRAGWTEALFARGQALARLKKWSDARTDFSALRKADPAWESAFVGTCNLRTGDNSLAFANFLNAYREGLRNVSFLMNYAKVAVTLQHQSEAAERYSEILAVEPANEEAVRNRALALAMAYANDKQRIPAQQAFEDVERCNQLAPDRFESALCGAIVYGEAARKQPVYQEKAREYLTKALQLGMPVEVVDRYRLQLRPLLMFVDGDVLMAARRDAKFVLDIRPAHDLPPVADWKAFQKRFGGPRRSLALGNTERRSSH